MCDSILFIIDQLLSNQLSTWRTHSRAGLLNSAGPLLVHCRALNGHLQRLLKPDRLRELVQKGEMLAPRPVLDLERHSPLRWPEA